MTQENKTVLVTGATGRQGGAVVRHMLPKGWKLRVLTRYPAGHDAQSLARQGVEVVQGDLEDPASIARAATGVYGIYSVQDFWAVGARREVQQGKNVADAAKKANVEHFVYSSVGGAERNTGIPHWESKWEVENIIRDLGLPATMIRPAAFMETPPSLAEQPPHGNSLFYWVSPNSRSEPERPYRPGETNETRDAARWPIFTDSAG